MRGVLGISEDGSVAYFACTGQLVPHEGNTAAEDEATAGTTRAGRTQNRSRSERLRLQRRQAALHHHDRRSRSRRLEPRPEPVPGSRRDLGYQGDALLQRPRLLERRLPAAGHPPSPRGLRQHRAADPDGEHPGDRRTAPERRSRLHDGEAEKRSRSDGRIQDHGQEHRQHDVELRSLGRQGLRELLAGAGGVRPGPGLRTGLHLRTRRCGRGRPDLWERRRRESGWKGKTIQRSPGGSQRKPRIRNRAGTEDRGRRLVYDGETQLRSPEKDRIQDHGHEHRQREPEIHGLEGPELHGRHPVRGNDPGSGGIGVLRVRTHAGRTRRRPLQGLGVDHRRQRRKKLEHRCRRIHKARMGGLRVLTGSRDSQLRLVQPERRTADPRRQRTVLRARHLRRGPERHHPPQPGRRRARVLQQPPAAAARPPAEPRSRPPTTP